MENKTYILLKDLPDAPIGTEVFIDLVNNYGYYQKSAWVSSNKYNYLTIATVTQSPEFFMEKSEYELKKELGYFEDFKVTGDFSQKTFKYKNRDCTQKELLDFLHTGELSPYEYLKLTVNDFDKEKKPKLFGLRKQFGHLLSEKDIAEYEERWFSGLTNKPMDKKIKGYKAPYVMFEGEVKKGDLYEKANVRWFYRPEKHSNGNIDKEDLYLPSEIVETWEPVYEEPFHVEQKEPVIQDANKIQMINNVMEFIAELNLKVQALEFVECTGSFPIKLKEEIELWKDVLVELKTNSK